MTPTDTQVGDQWGAVLDPHQRKAVEHAAMDAGAYSWRNCRLAMVEDGKVIGYPVFSRADMAELARLYREEPAPPAASVSPGTSNASEQKPCPFCGQGGEPTIKSDAARYRVICEECGACSDDFLTPESATGAWNRRAHPPTSYGKGESIDLMTVKAAFLWGYAKGSGGGLSAGEDEWSVYAQALQSIGGRTE